MVSGQFALIIKLLSFLRIKYFCTLVLGRFMTINGSVENALRCDSIKVLDLLIHSKFNQFVGMHVKGIQLISEKNREFAASKGDFCIQKIQGVSNENSQFKSYLKLFLSHLLNSLLKTIESFANAVKLNV